MLPGSRKSPSIAINKPVPATIEEQPQGYRQAGGDSELSQEYQLSALHCKYRGYLKGWLLVLGWDLFAVYKNDHQHAKNRTKCRNLFPPALQISRDNFDQWRRKVRIPVTMLICCLVFRVMTVGLIKIFDAVLLAKYIFNATRLDNLGGSSRALLDAYLSPNFVRSITPTYYQKFMQRVMDPSIKVLYNVTGTTSLFKALIAVSSFYIFILVAITNGKNPLNAPIERFMLDPSRELRRIDLATERHIDALIQGNPRNQRILRHPEQVASLRPCTYEAKWFHYLHRLSLRILAIVLMQTAIRTAALFYANYLSVKEPLCAINKIENCNFWSVFTVGDLIQTLEYVACFFGIVAVYTPIIIVFVGTNIASRLKLTRAASEDLKRCLSRLREANMLSLDQYLVNQSWNKSTSGSRKRIDQRLLDDPRAEQEIELCLFRTYVRLVVSLDEIRQIAQFVARVIGTVLLVIGSVFLTSLMNVIFNDMRVTTPQAIMLFNMYFITNPLMLVCSHAFARMVKLEKVGWSILAELAIYRELSQQKDGLRWNKSNRPIEVLAGRWRKLVRSHALSSERNASKPFGLSMTYGQVLNIDFFVISCMLVLLKI